VIIDPKTHPQYSKQNY